jgi:lysophospholipid hydrolase
LRIIQYSTLQFGKFEEITKKGYHAALGILEKFEEEGKIPSGLLSEKDSQTPGKIRGKSARRNSI